MCKWDCFCPKLVMFQLIRTFVELLIDNMDLGLVSIVKVLELAATETNLMLE